MPESLFQQTAAVLALTAVVSVIVTRLKQPLLAGFILTGLLVGPAVLGWVTPGSPLELLSGIGIAVLLFVVGLKLDLDLIRSVGPVALATGLGQVAFTSIVGFGICVALGMEVVEAAYVAIALTFSSTIIIVKLLSDKREIDSLHGRIAVGFLIVQDIVVVFVMIGLSVFAGGAETLAGAALQVVITGSAFVLGIAALMRWVLPRLLDALAKTPELLVLCAIAWAVTLAAAGDALGFSKEVGAFLAGVSIASTPYRESVASRLVSVRDFLLLFFFIELGSKLDLASAGARLPEAFVLSAFVLIGNPLIVVAIMGWMGYRRRTGLLAGLTVAQISEFSLILITLGVALGHIGGGTLGLVTVVGIVTIGLSTYLILYSHQLYEWLKTPLRIFERPYASREGGAEETHGPARVDVIIFGLGRFGTNIADRLVERGLTVLGVDFDPAAVRGGRQRGCYAQYGDADDPELTGTLPLSSASWVVSTLPQVDLNIVLRDAVIAYGFKGRFAATTHSAEDSTRLAERGVDLVLEPFSDAAEQAVELLTGEEWRGVLPSA